MVTESDARDMLKSAIPWKGAHKVAEQIGVSRGHLSEMMHGKKPINDKALAFIGCQRVIILSPQKDGLQSAQESA